MDELKREGAEIVQDNKNSSPVVLQNGGYTMHTFEDVKEIYYAYIHDEKDRKMIEDAYNYVKVKHEGIFRKSGEPYLQHLIEVAYIVASLQGGPTTIAAAFLHDVVEDTDTTVDDIKKKFGEDCARIVDALTKIQRLKLSHRTEEEFAAEDHKKIFLGMAKDVRVIIIKLADRLHNMRTIKALKPERQHALAKETLKDDPGMDMFNSGAIGDLGNHFKNMFVMKGIIKDPDPNKGYNIVTSSYMDGIKPQDYEYMANSLAAGPYKRGKKTQDGGYWEKLLLVAYQHLSIVSEDCGTKRTIDVALDEDNIHYHHLLQYK